MDQQVKQWLDYAAQDLGVAWHLFENYHPKPLEIVCYHCQQSAEKAIKAATIYRTTRLNKSKFAILCRFVISLVMTEL